MREDRLLRGEQFHSEILGLTTVVMHRKFGDVMCRERTERIEGLGKRPGTDE